MDSLPSDANNQIIISGVSSKSHEGAPEQGSPSVEQGESSESAAADPTAPAYQLAMAEYGCRYCHKKFSNKQALGGHQNAHKVERAMEKNMQETGIGYYDDSPNPYPPQINLPAPFLGSYPRHPDLLHRSLFSWSAGGGGGGGVVAYSPRPAGWSASASPAPRVPPFHARPHYTLPSHGQNMNVRLSNFGPGSSSAFRPVCNQGPSGFSGFVIRPDCSNLRIVPGNQHDESGLDLSLKLG